MNQLLLATLEQASVDQLEFESKILKNHIGRSEQRTGYRLVRVGGVPIPEAIGLSYVVGQAQNGEPFFYVVARLDDVGNEPRVFDVESVAAAKRAVLAELKAQLMVAR